MTGILIGKFLHYEGMKKKIMVSSLIWIFAGNIFYLCLSFKSNIYYFIIMSLLGRLLTGIVFKNISIRFTYIKLFSLFLYFTIRVMDF